MSNDAKGDLTNIEGTKHRTSTMTYGKPIIPCPKPIPIPKRLDPLALFTISFISTPSNLLTIAISAGSKNKQTKLDSN
jgi:hypothetical protein